MAGGGGCCHRLENRTLLHGHLIVGPSLYVVVAEQPRIRSSGLCDSCLKIAREWYGNLLHIEKRKRIKYMCCVMGTLKPIVLLGYIPSAQREGNDMKY